MNKRILLLLTLTSVAVALEPFSGLMDRYAKAFREYSATTQTVAESVRARYPRTFWVRKRDSRISQVTGVLGESEVKDTVEDGRHRWVRAAGADPTERIYEYDYDLLQEETKVAASLVPASQTVSVWSLLLKTAAVPALAVSDTFQASISQFDNMAARILEIAAAIRKTDMLFCWDLFQPGTAKAESAYEHWVRAKLDKKDYELARILDRFDTRYGASSDKLNALELVVVAWMPWFKGTVNGPSRVEPILRYTPVGLNVSDGNLARAWQVGLTYYFFEDAPALLRPLNHIGLAAALVDTSGRVVRWPIPDRECAPGAIVHAGKLEVGILPTSGWKGAKLIGAVNFQLIPTLF